MKNNGRMWIYLFGLVIILAGSFLIQWATKRDSDKTERNLRDDNERLRHALDKLTSTTNTIKELTDSVKIISDKINVINDSNNALIKTNNDISRRINALGIETNILTKNNNKQSEQIAIIASTIRDLNTGGSGLLKIVPNGVSVYEHDVQPNGYLYTINLELLLDGEYALDDVRIKGFLLNNYVEVDPLFLWGELSLSRLNIHSRYPIFPDNNNSKAWPEQWVVDEEFTVIKPRQRVMLKPIGLKKRYEKIGMDLFIQTKRQDWIILVRYDMNNIVGTTHPAPFPSYYRVLQVLPEGLKDVFSYPDSDSVKFVKWFKTPMPSHWFVDGHNPENSTE